MKISVVTPTWNRAARLRKSLTSVLSQNVCPREHVVVDNMSTDDTSAVIQEYARNAPYPVRHFREKDDGIYEAMNKGLAKATGDALHFLNDDDLFFDSNVLEMMTNCLELTGADIVFGDVVLLNDEKKHVHNYRRHRQVNRLTLVERTITQQAIFYRREVFKRCGIFDAQLGIAADHEWLLRAFLSHNIRAAYVKRPVAVFRIGGVSNDHDFRQMHHMERESITGQYFTAREMKAAKLYRKLFRKIPLGTALLNHFVPLRLNVQSLRVRNGRIVPDPLARLDL